MIGKDELAAAASENDSFAETQGFGPAIEFLGADEEGLLYVAKQRALRLVLILAGKPIPRDWALVKLTPNEMEKERQFTVAVLDGITIGLRAAKENR